MAMHHTLGGLMGIGVAVLMAAGVLVSYEVFRGPPPPSPRSFAFAAGDDPGTIVVVRAPNIAYWDELQVNGCEGVPTGPVMGGQRLEACEGHVSIIDLHDGRLVYAFEA